MDAQGQWRGWNWRQRWRWLRAFAVLLYEEMVRNRAFVASAALAFYFLLAMIPLLMVLASLLAFLPVPDVFGQLLLVMSTFVPPDAMGVVERAVAGVLTPHRGGVLGFGLLGYLWAASGGFTAAIEALDYAYDVEIRRQWWRDRLQALLLTGTTGALMTVSALALMAGPWFGRVLALLFDLPSGFEVVWKGLRLALMFVCFVIAVDVLYYMGPHVRHSFRSTLPGAAIAVSGWFVGSAGLNFYLAKLANYNSAYGPLAAVIGLLLWLYMVALAILLGAEANAELQKRRHPQGGSEILNQPMPGVGRA